MPNARVSVAGGAMPAPTCILEFTPTMRGLIENVIEDLILLLDEIDGDDDREPSLAHPGSYFGIQSDWDFGASDDCEEQHDAEEAAR